MKNKTLRECANKMAELVNGYIQQGVEPLFISMVLTNMSAQCEQLAKEFEAQEEKQEKEQNHDKENESVNG